MAKKRSVDRIHVASEKLGQSHQIPPISHLQFLVLDLLSRYEEQTAAQSLIEALSKFSRDYSGPKFYQLMSRLIQATLVKSSSASFDVAGTTVTRTYYELTQSGKLACRITAEFYLDRYVIQQLLSKK